MLPVAHEHGDKRSRHLLAKLLQKRGCGDTKKDDCYPCLRDLDDDKEKISVKDAIQAVTKRPGPKL